MIKYFLQTAAVLLFLGMSGVMFHFLGSRNISPSAFLGLPDEIKRPDIGMSFSGIRLIKKKVNETSVDLNADSGFINQKSDTIDLFRVEGSMRNSDGQPVDIVSRHGRYLKEQGVLVLSGGILATIDKRVRLKTENLRWDSEKRVLTTNDFVTITNTENSFRVTGTGLEYTADSEEMTVKKDVSAIFF